jgi:predicted Zn-dependent protease
MSAGEPRSDIAHRIAERIRADGPWDVFAERTRRYEIHLNGRAVELTRGPILVEGYGIRVLRPREGATGTGFQASTDLTDSGVAKALESAEALSHYSSFPARQVRLPGALARSPPSVEVRDPKLWDHPLESLQEFVDALVGAFDGKRDVAPTFGSVRANLVETTLANSEGLRYGYDHTMIDFEVAVKSFGGPEGPPPGEYWVNDATRRLDPSGLLTRAEEWSRYARDVRRASPTPTGELPAILPPSVLNGILPPVIGARMSGGARLREIAPAIGAPWGNESITIVDDGLVPWAIASSPIDDEGVPQGRRELIRAGKVASLFYDVRHSSLFGTEPTGNGFRGFTVLGSRDWRRFMQSPSGNASTLAIAAGAGGSDEELIEAAGDGIWVQQLAWAFPDAMSGAFGGELRIGYRIRGGKLAEPIRGGTVGGVVMSPNGGPSLLSNVAAVGSRVELTDSVEMPSLLVRPLTVAGATT